MSQKVTTKKEAPVAYRSVVEVPLIAKVTYHKGIQHQHDTRIFREAIYGLEYPDEYRMVGLEQVVAVSDFEKATAEMQDTHHADEDVEREYREELSHQRRNLVVAEADIPNFDILSDDEQQKLTDVQQTTLKRVVVDGEKVTKYVHSYHIGQLSDQLERNTYYVPDVKGDPGTNMTVHSRGLYVSTVPVSTYTCSTPGQMGLLPLHSGQMKRKLRSSWIIPQTITTHEAELYRSADRLDSGARRITECSPEGLDREPQGVLPTQRYLKEKLGRFGEQLGDWQSLSRDIAKMLDFTVNGTTEQYGSTKYNRNTWLYGVGGKKIEVTSEGVLHSGEYMGIFYDLIHEQKLASKEERKCRNIMEMPTYLLLEKLYNGLMDLQLSSELNQPLPEDTKLELHYKDYVHDEAAKHLGFDPRAWHSDAHLEFENQDYNSWDDPEAAWVGEGREVVMYEQDCFHPIYPKDHNRDPRPVNYDHLIRLDKMVTVQDCQELRHHVVTEFAEILDLFDELAETCQRKLNKWGSRYAAINGTWWKTVAALKDRLFDAEDQLDNLFHDDCWAYQLSKSHYTQKSQLDLLWGMARYAVKGSLEKSSFTQKASLANKESMEFYALSLFGEMMHAQKPEEYSAMPSLTAVVETKQGKSVKPSETMKDLCSGMTVREFAKLQHLNPVANYREKGRTSRLTFRQFESKLWNKFQKAFVKQGQVANHKGALLTHKGYLTDIQNTSSAIAVDEYKRISSGWDKTKDLLYRVFA